MTWIDNFDLVECAVMTFKQWKRDSYMRYHAVRALRTLWKHGDADTRSTIACRIAVWFNTGRIEGMSQRIMAREKARLAKST